ncbi:hypothetical protein AAW00_12870 [Aurantiacibacter luteus]|uniref:Uncharacterized protein n=1 Tax=Aurantiacibacter luteus TaxID=1581420 RepID=A0A0G9MNR1_9SPHN|nr:hypothetical protein AAW00_12870 [Aurantiacibacter luteus]
MLLLGGCATAQVDAPRAAGDAPTGATLSRAGHATIGEVPPSPFPADPPPMPTQLDVMARQTSLGTPEERARAWENAGSTPALRAAMEEVMPRLEAEPTYVQSRIAGEPGAKVLEVFFTRDAEATLARYTSDPLVVARTGGRTQAELEPVMRLWWDRLEAAGRPAGGGSLDTIGGAVEINTGITRAEFNALAARNGWPDPLGEPVRFTFAAEQARAFADPSLARLVRSFARESMEPGIQLTGGFSGRVVLEDGCFVLDGGRGSERTLVMFGRDAQLAQDEEGYLIVRRANAREPDEAAGYRIGEAGFWGGPNGFDENDAEVRALRAACGPGEIMNVRYPGSERLFALPYPLWVFDYAYSRGLTYDAAWDEVMACYKRQERRGRTGFEARDACITQYNGWDYVGEEMPPPPPGR